MREASRRMARFFLQVTLNKRLDGPPAIGESGVVWPCEEGNSPMSRNSMLDALVEDMLCEMEVELEGEFESEDAGAFSCSGWESDPQSFSISAARNFCRDAFNVTVSTADTVTCTGQTCVVHFTQPGGWPTFNITVDMSQVPGVVTVSGTADPFRMRGQTCSYRYTCDFNGAIAFTRIRCTTT